MSPIESAYSFPFHDLSRFCFQIAVCSPLLTVRFSPFPSARPLQSAITSDPIALTTPAAAAGEAPFGPPSAGSGADASAGRVGGGGGAGGAGGGGVFPLQRLPTSLIRFHIIPYLNAAEVATAFGRVNKRCLSLARQDPTHLYARHMYRSVSLTPSHALARRCALR
jgi:hypothetical protein